MAKSPAEVLKAVEQLHKDNINKWENSIDEGLVEGRRTFAIMNRHKFVISAIVEKYRYLGWKVDVISDPRDGPYLQFWSEAKS